MNLFNTWRILFYGFIGLCILFSIFSQGSESSIYISSILVILVILYQVVSSYSILSYDGETLRARSFNKSIELKKYSTHTSWWSYELGESTKEVGEGNSGQTRGHINKINCFVRFKGGCEDLTIFEQIHMGDKSPHQHQYKPAEKIDKNRLIKVWDIDKCLLKLGL